ncbi:MULTISPECIES: nitroreductase family protein [Clostridium]|uniref:Putative NAD(P)H nitroreductase YodC n=1 Tax=Clostridium ragsdalei P11 TaxID=1353534 RepID=A0A1A6B3A8_9CLOT|nr:MULTISPECIES: nitroreductase family protein [Clostridium]OBR96772.1 putative NAD(P)H nitroreductase YodC [Clostridium ragsdalei P11]QXE18330.1 nitroreductase [Clostridium sp. 001]
MIKELVLKNRSCRRFYQDEKITVETLKELVNLARLSASGSNLQPLKYVISNTKDNNEKIFKTLGWAGYLKDWNGPEEGEKPSGYIVILNDTSISKSPSFDPGIAAQTILLGAVEKGFGGCMLGNVNKKELKLSLNLDEKYEIILVVALGKPKEQVVIEAMDSNNDVKYWRDENKVHHVPKRSLEDIILDI